MKNKRVLICGDHIFDNAQGGAARSILEIARELKGRGCSVTLLIRGLKDKKSFETFESISVYRHKDDIFLIFKFLKNITTEGLDVVNFHDPYSSFWVLLYLIFTGVKVPRIYTFQSPWPTEYYIRAGKKRLPFLRTFFGVHLRRELEKFTLKNSDKITVASDFMKKELLRLYGLEAAVLPLGVNLERFIPPAPAEEFPENIKPVKNGRMFFTLRNLEPRMGLENLLKAVKILSDKGHKNLGFVIGGTGSLETELKKMAGELGVESQVRFAGHIPDESLRFYYAAADAFILPTKELEGFGLVTLEAMACGCPVLATPVGANPEVAGGFPGNMIFKSEKAEDIAEGIEEFMKAHPEIKKEERTGCREYAEKNYSWEKYVDGFEKIYAGCPLCGGTSARRFAGFDKCRDCGFFYNFQERSCPTKNYEEKAEHLIYGSSVEKIFGFALKKMKILGGRGGKLLDIGCASGNFMELAAKEGWEPEGIEIAGEMAAKCARKGLTAYEKPVEDLPLPDGKYDAVTLFSVLCLMSDPFSAFKKIEKILKPGGLLVVREYNSSFHRWAYKAVSFLSFLKVKPFIFHKWNFSEKSLRIMLENNGFKVLLSRNSPLTKGDPYGTGGHLGKAGVSLFKSFYSFLAGTVYYLSLRKIFISSSIMVFARKKKDE